MFPLLPQEQEENPFLPDKFKQFEDKPFTSGGKCLFVIFIIIFFPFLFPCICISSFILHTGEAFCVTHRGRYAGTTTKSGCYFLNPFYKIIRRSLKQETHSTNLLQVNDKKGNPIEIKVVFVYRIINVAASCFNVENLEQYITLQGECALRNLAAKFKYDSSDPNEQTLVNGGKFFKQMLINELNERLSIAGITVDDANITHLSYAKEIIGIMLKKQYASTIVQAKEKLVKGISGVVRESIDSLEKKFVIPKEIKNNIASNLLVSLFSDNPNIACLHMDSNQEGSVNLV